MDIQLYNTLTRTKEVVKPLTAGAISIYQCGPTVYDTPHVGNYRTMVFYDLIRRVCEYNDYQVHQVMNITDVGHLVDESGGPAVADLEPPLKETLAAQTRIVRQAVRAFAPDERGQKCQHGHRLRDEKCGPGDERRAGRRECSEAVLDR